MKRCSLNRIIFFTFLAFFCIKLYFVYSLSTSMWRYDLAVVEQNSVTIRSIFRVVQFIIDVHHWRSTLYWTQTGIESLKSFNILLTPCIAAILLSGSVGEQSRQWICFNHCFFLSSFCPLYLHSTVCTLQW